MEEKARILIIRFSSIGDIVLTTPVIRVLHEQLHGGAEIHYLTKKKFASLLSSNPYITRIHTIEKTVQEVLPELEKIHFDYIIDLHNNIRSSVTKRRLKSLAFTFKKLNIQKWLWVNFGVNLMPDVHVVDRYLDALKAFNLKPDGKGLDYFIPEGEGIADEEMPPAYRNGYIAWALGGAHIGKKMDREKIASLCSRLNVPIVLLGGPEDSETGEYVASVCGDHVYNASGKCTLHQSASWVKHASVVVAGDTGLMHIASAFRKKIVSLWGCTVPGFGMYPYYPHPDSVIIEPEGRTKRPCSKLGDRCKYGKDNRCIQHLNDDYIIETVQHLYTS